MPGSWENSADAYAQSFARLCAGTVEEILVRLGSGERDRLLLDVGTGPGTVAAAARTHGYTAIGMDRDASMITLAGRRHPEIAYAQAALPGLPCRDRVFDAVTANFVINHTPDPRRAARELFRVIRSGGCLVATTWPSQIMPLNQFWNEVMQRAEV
ncbi:MAG: class I SAM-dependent methyltransferase, partial [Microlunatus sp.]